MLARGARRLRPRFSKDRLAHISRVQAAAIANKRRSAVEESLGSIVSDALTSPLGLGLQIAMLIGLALLAGGVRPRGGAPSAPLPAQAPSADAAQTRVSRH